jgi:hypothetical protein
MQQKSKSKVFQLLGNMDTREIIMDQLIAYLRVDIRIYWSWGVSKLCNFADKALLMKTSGKYHKFWVMITLNSLDLFDVTLLNEDYTVKCAVKNLYFDQLQEVIDDLVETNPNAIAEAIEREKEIFS